MSIPRYLDISSAYRDRTQFPNPFDFQVSYTNASAQSNPANINDSVSSAMPYHGDTTSVTAFATSTSLPNATDVTLNTSASLIEGYYLGEYIDFVDYNSRNDTGALRTVTYTNPPSSTVQGRFRVLEQTIQSSTTIITIAPEINSISNVNYYFRHSPPLTSYSVMADLYANTATTTSNTLVLDATTATANAVVKIGQLVKIYNASSPYQLEHTATITNVAGSTITFSPSLTGLTGAHNYIISDSSYLPQNTTNVVVKQIISDASKYIGMWIQGGSFIVTTMPTGVDPTNSGNEVEYTNLWESPKRIVSVNVNTTDGYTVFNLNPSPSIYLNDVQTYLPVELNANAGYQQNAVLYRTFYILDVVNNNQPLMYNGTTVGTQVPRCYMLDLVDFIISGISIIGTSPSGPVSSYPYLYVEIQAESQHTNNVLVSNNPYSKKALFKVPTGSDMITTFFNLRSSTSQVIKFKPNDTFNIRVLRPDGIVLGWLESDSSPPQVPNPLLQISLTIRFSPSMCVDDV